MAEKKRRRSGVEKYQDTVVGMDIFMAKGFKVARPIKVSFFY